MRPNPFLDAAKLDAWMENNYPDKIDEWELSGVAEWDDLWDWVEREYPQIFDRFIKEATCNK